MTKEEQKALNGDRMILGWSLIVASPFMGIIIYTRAVEMGYGFVYAYILSAICTFGGMALLGQKETRTADAKSSKQY